MGIHENIGFDPDQWPTQGRNIGKLVRIIYNYDRSRLCYGVCIRDDLDSPYRTLFLCRDPEGKARVVESVECQYSPHDCDGGIL